MELRNSTVESRNLDLSQPIQKIDDGALKIAAAKTVVVADGGGGGGKVVKRKRGRPPKAHANVPSAKKSKEEDEEEDVCFICFDGGSLVLCDRRGCPKAYHPYCVKRDEAFFQSKAKWNCGWHICSVCEKTAHHMCYTCTYSLCKGCIRESDYVCVRGDKGFCTVCMKTIMLIENNGDATAQVDFDDKNSWEYLFKVYWVYVKGKLSLTLDELTKAKNPWKTSNTLASIDPTVSHISASGRRSITAELSFANESKRRKTDEQENGLPKGNPSMDGPKEWASKELVDLVAHMKNGDTSVLSHIDVQTLLLEYIRINNLRDPRKKSQIICDLRLMNLFGKPRVGHIEMLKLLEFHFLVKKDPQKVMTTQGDTDGKTENMVVVGNKERRSHRKGEKRMIHNKLDEYAAIDVHNMNLIYLRRNLMESFIDNEKFYEKVVGSIVQIRISGSDQKDDMYRLVQVVGMTKVDEPYKIGDKSASIMLEVLNLDKKETVSIDTISNQELSEDECRRLRESIKCGLVRCFTVGEIQEKAMALQPMLLDDRMETEVLRLNQLRDRASEKGQKKGVRECVKKLKLLKTPEERERRLQEIPEVHSDPKMNPDYESDDTEEYFNNEHGEHLKPKFPWLIGTCTISPKKTADDLNDQPKESGVVPVNEDSSKSNTGKDVIQLSSSKIPQSKVESPVSVCKQETVVSSSSSNIALESRMNNRSVDDDRWHYRDLSGNVQGPFSMLQMQKWSTGGYFPADMRIWEGVEADSLLLNNVLREHFHHYDGQLSQSVACNSKVDNQVESVAVCTEIPSSPIPATSNSLINSVNLEKMPDNLNCDPTTVVSLTKKNEKTENFGTQSMPDITEHVSSAFTVADPALVELPNPLLEKENLETEKIQDSVDKEPSKLLVQESGNLPSWSTTLSLVVGGTQIPETANSSIDQITNLSSWHGIGETIEFSTLAEESVSDLLAEVDAMESRNGVPSPTSRRNSFLEDLFNGSIDDFSPTADQVTRSDAFSSTADIHLSRQSTEIQITNSDNTGFKWAEMGGSLLQPHRQDMIDLNFSTRAEAEEGERETGTDSAKIEEKSKTRTIVKAETRVGGKSNEKAGKHVKAEVAGTKANRWFPEVEEEEGEFIQQEAAPPPRPPQPLPPLLPLPRQPPLLPLPLQPPTMGLDVVDSRRMGSGRQSQGTTSTGRVHSASRSGNTGRDSHHRRSGGGDRYNGNNKSPRERGHHVEDPGYGRSSSRTSWSRQSSFNGGGGSGYSRPPSKGQRVCKFYESGRCIKGSACTYLHPQNR